MGFGNSFSLFAFFLLCTSVLILTVDAWPSRIRCPPDSQSAEEVARLRESCKYGVYEDNCSRIKCAKGPGEVCGNGMFARTEGRCGDGTYCKCGRCLGCNTVAVPMECFEKTCFRSDD